MDFVISPGFSFAFKYCTIYGVWGSQGSFAMFLYGFPETCMEIWQFVRGNGVVVVMVLIRVHVRDIREDVSIYNSPGTRIRRIIVGDACVGFDFSYVRD